MIQKIKNLRFSKKLTSDVDKTLVKKYVNYLIKWLRKSVKNANANGVVLGLSGGIDSAVVAVLAKQAFPDNYECFVMPIDSMQNDLNDLNSLIEEHNLKVKTINLEKSYQAIIEANKNVVNTQVLGNIKPRLRMTTLYAQAQNKNYLVLGTDNFDEYTIGYFTKYGDGGVDLLPISYLTKDDVRIVAEYLKIPQSIITKKPSAGLWENQSDEKELGFSYNDLDNYLLGNFNDVNIEISNKIKQLNKNTEHKRNSIPRPLSIKEFTSK
ncbi:NAD(+) synthase [Mycoplasma sp. Mirounga ES2805-ORL]|uniref:NAD(+) synthase n=1 Tax=Mycoplasma sp. Mirounga ES2805-ORL TaxID=754514 RepID=UPI00197C97BB|nr:NAD(+) synthase [Mycoplasma sp. Mirounga ES2805-ORL]QSF13607.1 NAD(+) synthase [Mycoplasma sp. Mirounga ES2805-ORL]